MNIESFRDYCNLKKGVSESFPFDESTLVFKVLDKIFTITDLNEEFKISLKCDPEKAIILREKYNAVKPGWHLNKKHWNTILIDDSIPDNILEEWINDSYLSVINKMTKKDKIKLSKM